MMRFNYYFFKFVTGLMSLLPFWLVYCFSGVAYFLLYYIVGYRKKVVMTNLENAFPDKTEKERAAIAKAFYKNLSDILLEALKGFSMNKEAVIKRYKFLNPEVMNKWFDLGKNVISVGAHYTNWEWGIMAGPSQMKHLTIAFYNPLMNKFIDNHLCSHRKKFGTELISTKEAKHAMEVKHDIPATYFFGADQSPSNLKMAHWMTFLNQDTACNKGMEFFSRRSGLPVVYFDVQRVKRGYYTVKLIELTSDASSSTDGEITEKYMRTLEDIILQKPQDWLWSHRRWKQKR